MPRSLSDRDWQTLVYSIRQERCVLLVGPDIPVSDESSSRSLVGELVRELAADLGTLAPTRSTLAEIAQQYVAAPELGRNDLENAVATFFGRQMDLSSRIHEDLAAVGFPLVISSCHDGTLESAMLRAGLEPVSEHYHFRGPARDMVRDGTREAPLVYHLHGSIREPESLVLTETDLLDFLVAVISNKPSLPHNIRSGLQAKGRSFLFLGFGMNRWHLRILVHVLRGPRPDSRSFAFEPQAEQEATDYQQAVMFYQRGFKVDVFEVDLPLFISELRRRVEAASAEVSKAAPPLSAPSPPRVFISYDRRNQTWAQQIYDHLAKESCEPWLDRERLSVGYRWNEAIEKAIDETDYFLLVHSHEVASRSEGYVVREINRARDRVKSFRSGISFLLPVRIDRTPLMPELSEFHMLDLSTGGLDGLWSSIFRDWQRRQR